jgi:hypothetical protein
MNKEILSLQSLAEKLRLQQANIDAKFAEQKPILENLTHVWRTIILGVVAATIIAILTFAIPSVYALGQIFLNYWSSKTVAPTFKSKVSLVATDSLGTRQK